MLFFIITGFVLSYNYFNSHNENYLKKSAFKRYFRLILPILIVNIFAFLLMKFKLTYNVQVAEITKFPEWIINFNTFEPNFFLMIKETFIGNFFYHIANYVSPLWTISYEMYGSLLVFAFLGLFGKEKVRYPIYIIFFFLFKESYYSQFIMGIMICDIMINMPKIINFFKSQKVFNFLIFIIGIYFASYPTRAIIDNTIYKFIEFNSVVVNHFIGASLIIFAIVTSDLLQKLFELKIFKFLGKYSYALYLTHWPIMISFSSYIIVRFYKFSHYYRLLLIDFSITMIIILVLSILLTKFVDSKGIKFSNKITNYFFKNK